MFNSQVLWQFIDIDECGAGVSNCDTNAACANIDGTFTCTCNSGFEGDGTVCAGKFLSSWLSSSCQTHKKSCCKIIVNPLHAAPSQPLKLNQTVRFSRL